MPQTLTVNIKISADEYLTYYQGQAKRVRAVAEDGRSVLFPASVLQRFITHDGIKGRFIFSYDDNGKFINVSRI